MNRLASSIIGIASIALGLYIAVRCYHLLDLAHEERSVQLGRPVPPLARVPGGIAGLVLFAIPAVVVGIRFILKPGPR